MISTWLYVLVSVFVVSLISLIGIFTLSIQQNKLKQILIYLVSFAAGALFGDALLHLLPEAVKGNGMTIALSSFILLGIVVFFILEKFIHWHHYHYPISKGHVHPFAITNLLGDGIHNFLDGIIIAGSYLISIPVGIATSLAVIFHEIPQEISDFGILLHGGFKRGKALFLNFLSALAAVLGAIIALIIGKNIEGFIAFIAVFTIGVFIYIAGSDLIPELHKETKASRSLLQLMTFLAGILIMYALTFIG